MNLATLLQDPSLPDIRLRGLAEHTAEVDAGYGYCAISSNQQTLEAHCRSAVQRGAVALLMDAAIPRQAQQFGDVPQVAVADLAQRRGQLAARFYADPSAQLSCVGVTGTNGKTSTAFHIVELLELLGGKAGYVGTLGAGQLHDLHDLNMTTPNPVALQRLLAGMVDQGLQYAALEVSSHALAQHRADDVAFDYAVFTNISRDHLDYHGTMQAYQQAKARLFLSWPIQAAVINTDDEFGRELAQRCVAPVITYGKSGQWQWHIEPRAQADGTATVHWQTPYGSFRCNLHVVADYALANLTAAMAVVVAMGQPVAEVFARLEQLRGVPGRMQRVPAGAGAPLVVVDYAHTPDALEKVLVSLVPAAESQAGKLICVVGCGGDRDVGKRPQMGAIAQQHADVVWLTSDNPRSEDPHAIIADMQQGIPAQADAVVHVEVDRRQAIVQAIAQAQPQDLVLIAGKGHETYQEIQGQQFAFDDWQIAQQQLEGSC